MYNHSIKTDTDTRWGKEIICQEPSLRSLIRSATQITE